jgi:mannose-6-phosphate isomerase-like protein (cupin superfamily)
LYITNKDRVAEPKVSRSGEMIFELTGKDENRGAAQKHDLAHVVIPLGKSSRNHYHPEAEETYYILKGQAKLVINSTELTIGPGDTILIHALDRHQIFSAGSEDLEFLVVCSPPWEPSNTVYVD